MEQRSDVVVVGAGVVGLATALALLADGRSVRVIEARTIGSGSSHGNCGTITPSHAPPLAAPGRVGEALRMILRPDAPLYIRPRVDAGLWRWLWRFAGRCNLQDWEASARAKSLLLNDSRERLAEWIRAYGLACEFAASGEDYVFRSLAAFERGQRELDLLRELGVEVEVIEGPAYDAIEPAVLPGTAGAIRFRGDAVLRPDRYVDELARVVRAHGGVIDEDRPLQRLDERGAGVALQTADGTLEAGEVVIAAGAWSPRLAQALDARWLGRAMQPGKGYSITYDPPALVPRRPLVLRDWSVCVTSWPSGFRLGSTMEFSGFDSRLHPRRLAALERAARASLREPVGPVVRERWCGWRPMSCDDVPIIGRLPGHRHSWLATGHGMMGVGMSAGTGQLVADLMAGRVPAMDPGPFDPARLAG